MKAEKIGANHPLIIHSDPQTIEPASASIGQVDKKNFLSFEPKQKKVAVNKN